MQAVKCLVLLCCMTFVMRVVVSPRSLTHVWHNCLNAHNEALMWSAGKIVRLRQKLVDMADSVKGLFGAKKQQDNAVEKMERLKV